MRPHSIVLHWATETPAVLPVSAYSKERKRKLLEDVRISEEVWYGGSCKPPNQISAGQSGKELGEQQIPLL